MRMKCARAYIVLALVLVLLLTSCGPSLPELTPQDSVTPPAIVVEGTLMPAATTPPPSVASLPPTLSPGQTTPAPEPSATYYEQDPDAEPPADWKKWTTSDFDVILVGKFVKELREDNASRATNDLSKPDPNFWNGVKVYDFTIETVFKGKVSTKQIEVALEYYDQNIVKKLEKVYNQRFVEPELNVTYVIGLAYDKDLKWYVNDTGVEPQRFRVVDNGLVFESKHAPAVSVWEKVTPITLDAFKKLVK